MNVSVLGLGQMGASIAERLIGAGHDVAVWNRTESIAEPFAGRGVRVLSRPADAWAHGDTAIVMLAHDAAVEAVLLAPDGLLTATGDGRTLIEMSTISVAGSARLAARAQQVGTAFLRAPVTGNPSVVSAGNLGIIVSGPRAAYRAVEPMLRDVGPNHFYVGTGEQARVVKLALNLMIGGIAQLMAEALVLAERNDIDRETMLEVMGGSAVGAPFVQYKSAALVADDYTSTFTARALYKDLALALDCANGADLPLPVTAVVQQLVQGCISQGMGDLDLMALLPRMRREAGIAEPLIRSP
jgi:3-hydroxyisobutyrate dehydrogenase-like beta-hydroxyacid dehydrogenase